MSENWWIDPLATAVIVGVLLWALEPIAYRLGLLDHPGGRKDHGHPTPIIGGIAMAIGIFGPVLYAGSFPPSYLGFMLGSAMLVGIGLIDDVTDVRWYWRLLVQVSAALVMVYVGGVRVEYLGALFGGEPIDLGPWSVPFTVFATVGVINAFNMCDGVDGLAGSLAVAALTMYCAAAIYSGNGFMVERIAPVIAAVLVFLAFNLRSPWRARARVFMGDAGSAFLGYLICWVCFRLTQNPAHPVTPVLAPFFIAPPIIDCLCLIVRRLKERRSPFAAGRDHIHHLLLDAGFSPTQIALGLAGVSFALGLAAAVTLRSNVVPDLVLVIGFVLLTIAYYRFSLRRERAIARLRRLYLFLHGKDGAEAPPRAVAPAPASEAPSWSVEGATPSVAVFGVGDVGLPLAIAFGRHFPTVGYDLDAILVAELKAGHARSEADTAALRGVRFLSFSDSLEALAASTIFIVAVPATPSQDDVVPLIAASRAIGTLLKRGDLVVFESTLYPGAIEELCVPELERISGLALERDFGVGYSPTRIDPGEGARTLATLPKVTAGSSDATAAFVDALYRRVVVADTHRAPSIRVAEAAKAMETAQRDANVALVNEFALVFHRLGIDTRDAIAAASSSWSFLPFRPGLVAARHIGLDTTALIERARRAGHEPDVLVASRRVNDSLGRQIASEIVESMATKGIAIDKARILLLGLTLREDAPESRDTRVLALARELVACGARVELHDPWIAPDSLPRAAELTILASMPTEDEYDAVVLCVAHREFRALDAQALDRITAANAVVYDLVGELPRERVDRRL